MSDTVKLNTAKVHGREFNLLSYMEYTLPGDKTALKIYELFDFDELYGFYRSLLGYKATVSAKTAMQHFVQHGHWGFCSRSNALIAYSVLQDENYSKNKIEVISHELDHLLRPAKSLEESELSASRTGFMASAAFDILAETNKQAINLVGADMIHVRGTI